ncbi:Fpg/Nei family DNA glycosylase [Janibacter melonis]|uniref:Fpg/Nei family DNA glycosylase n=1 Tax=Janibacter melonis TaxID=262209 RepID=UPI001919E7F2|nr:zinc finger domain-containing protein [Janibacter melonis]
MPEGHTLARIAGALDAAFADSEVQVSSPQGRFAAGAELLDGGVVREARSHGKQLFVEVEPPGSPEPRVLHVHLGLIGTFTIDEVAFVGEKPVVGQVRCRIEGEGHVADLRGPMVCAVITPEEEAGIRDRLGPDPLREESGERGWERVTRSRKEVAALLMDQSVVAGIGNVYRCEVLFRHRVDPATPGRALARDTWDAIWADLRRLMPLGVATGRIVTREDQVEVVEEAMAKGETPHLTERTSYVYRRTGEPCRVCGAPVSMRDLAGRKLYWCAVCQTGT